MITIIAGSRSINDYNELLDALKKVPWVITEIVSGHASGVDMLGEQYAKENDLKLHLFKADWNKYGKRAGFIRNGEMAEYAGVLLAIWDGKSRGTKDMIRRMKRKKKLVYVYMVGG